MSDARESTGDQTSGDADALLEELLGTEDDTGRWHVTEVEAPAEGAVGSTSPNGTSTSADHESGVLDRQVRLRSVALWLLLALLVVLVGGVGYLVGIRQDDETATVGDETGAPVDAAPEDPNATASADGDEADGSAAGVDTGTGDDPAASTDADGADVSDDDGADDGADDAAAAGANLTATLERGRFSIQGAVPSAEIATAIRTTSGIVYGPAVVDELTIDPSLPEPGWGPAAVDLVASLPIISNGSIRLDAESVTISGTAGSAAKQQAFRGAVQQLLGPEIELVDEVEVVEMDSPSLIISKTEPQAIDVTGVVPNEEVAGFIQQSLTAAYRGHSIRNDLTIGDVEETFALYGLTTFAGLFFEFPAWEVNYVDEVLTSSSSGAASFETDSADLPPTAPQILDSFAAGMQGIPGLRLMVEGHTDSTGDSAYNQQLSERRAQAVVDYLVENHGLDPARLMAMGLGETRPIADNDTEKGRMMNRRVDFIIQTGGQ